VKDSSERAGAQVLVIGHDEPNVRDFTTKNNMAAALALDHETDSLESLINT